MTHHLSSTTCARCRWATSPGRCPVSRIIFSGCTEVGPEHCDLGITKYPFPAGRVVPLDTGAGIRGDDVLPHRPAEDCTRRSQHLVCQDGFCDGRDRGSDIGSPDTADVQFRPSRQEISGDQCIALPPGFILLAGVLLDIAGGHLSEGPPASERHPIGMRVLALGNLDRDPAGQFAGLSQRYGPGVADVNTNESRARGRCRRTSRRGGLTAAPPAPDRAAGCPSNDDPVRVRPHGPDEGVRQFSSVGQRTGCSAIASWSWHQSLRSNKRPINDLHETKRNNQ